MKKLKQPNRRQVYVAFTTLSILALAGYTVWQTREIRQDIGALYDSVNQQAENVGYYDSAEEMGVSSEVTYKVSRQYVEKLGVLDPKLNFKYDDDPVYIEKDVRVVEVEVNNNSEWVYSAYSSIGTIDDAGKITRTISSIDPDQDKNNNGSGYSLELAPGGVGTTYLYFEDNGTEITKLFDIDNSKELSTQ